MIIETALLLRKEFSSKTRRLLPVKNIKCLRLHSHNVLLIQFRNKLSVF